MDKDQVLEKIKKADEVLSELSIRFAKEYFEELNGGMPCDSLDEQWEAYNKAHDENYNLWDKASTKFDRLSEKITSIGITLIDIRYNIDAVMENGSVDKIVEILDAIIALG